MDIIKLILQILFIVLGSFAAFLSILFFRRLRWPAALWWFLKLYTSALSPLLFLVGILTIIVGQVTGSLLISLIGIYDAIIYFTHIVKITRPPAPSNGFEQVFGQHWEDQIKSEQKRFLLPHRATLRLPSVPEPRLAQDVSFATIPGTGRKLLCDIWRPSSAITPSGLAFIYLHGSAFYLLDKDFATRPFFRHLAAQGHTIMDVAYRLSPETDISGMVNDVNRAIAWMKENADAYGVNPDRIVLGGGSAGGQLALLTAYAPNHPKFMPKDLEGKDTGVCAVISLYGSNDLKALYYHTNQHLTTRSIPGKPKKAVPTKLPGWIIKRMGEEYHRLGMDKSFEHMGALAPLLGGHPDECPETYAFFSPVNHIHPGCPPTLLVHDEDDIMAPIESTRILHGRLVEEKVPTVMHILQQTDHAFDLIMPKISLSAHNLIYDVERFLALINVTKQAGKKEKLSPFAEDGLKGHLQR